VSKDLPKTDYGMDGYLNYYVLKHVIEGKVEGRIELTGRREGRHKQLLNYLNETGRYWKFKEEALDRTLWRTHFRGGCGPVVRQTTEWTTTTLFQLPQSVGEYL
jgi:hypothetical protein